MEAMRVDWCRLNQKQLRAETENGLEEHVAAQEASSRVLAIFLASFCLVPLFASARLAARVFHIKLQALLDDLTKAGVLCRVIAWTYVVEFLLIVHPDDKPRTPADIDARTCAELPQNADVNQGKLRDCRPMHAAWPL